MYASAPNNMNEKKEKKLIIISGGNGYLGSAVAKKFTESEWTVATLSRNKDTANPLSYACDITDDASVASAVKSIVDTHGLIHACVHAASEAVDGKTKLLDVPPAIFDTQISIAVKGAFIFAKTAIPYMTQGSAFIGITSALIEPGVTLSPMGAYISAKYALRGFLRSLAPEVNSQGIRVYAVAPGYLPGGLNRGIPEALITFLGKKSGAGDAKVEDVAEMVRQICIDESSFPTGTSISIPGGAQSL